MRINKGTCIVWLTTLIATYLSTCLLVLTKNEKLLIAAILLLLICLIEDLILPRNDKNDGVSKWIQSPSIIALLIPTFLLGGRASYFGIIITSRFFLITICTALICVIVRILRFYRHELFEAATIITIIIMTFFYLWVVSFSFFVINCELDQKHPSQIETVVIDKGYVIDGVKGPDFERRLVLKVKADGYGVIEVDTDRDAYIGINKGAVLLLNFSTGVLGEKYYYTNSKWTYPYIESTFMNKDFKRFINHEKELED